MTFSGLRTERLLLRPVRADNAEALAARRSDPGVARYQNWTAPCSAERARAHGFVPTGEIEDGEIVARLHLVGFEP